MFLIRSEIFLTLCNCNLGSLHMRTVVITRMLIILEYVFWHFWITILVPIPFNFQYYFPSLVYCLRNYIFSPSHGSSLLFNKGRFQRLCFLPYSWWIILFLYHGAVLVSSAADHSFIHCLETSAVSPFVGLENVCFCICSASGSSQISYSTHFYPFLMNTIHK